MAYPTVEQKDVITPLMAEYGTPRFTKIELTSDAYGIIWIQWPIVGDVGDQRNLFIKPDGSRLSWSRL
jgi:hypothetical protein